MPGFLDQHSLAQFQRDGFLAFKPQIPADEIRMLRSVLTDLHENGTGFKEGALFDAIGVDDGSEARLFPQILPPRPFAPALLDTDFYPTANAIANQMLGEDVRLKANIPLLKPANIGAATPW